MNDTTRCGLWRERGRTVAVVVDTEGRCQCIAPPPDDEAERWNWLGSLAAEHGLDVELALTASMARSDSLLHLAQQNGITLWLIPDELVDAIRYVAFGRQRRQWVAALLARIPDAAAWRAHLRRQASNDDRRQLLLL